MDKTVLENLFKIVMPMLLDMNNAKKKKHHKKHVNITHNVIDEAASEKDTEAAIKAEEKANNLNSDIKNSINTPVKENAQLSPDQPANLLDIINDSYTGVNITASFVDSSILTGEVMKTIGNVLVMKSSNLIYYIDKDKLMYFF